MHKLQQVRVPALHIKAVGHHCSRLLLVSVCPLQPVHHGSVIVTLLAMLHVGTSNETINTCQIKKEHSSIRSVMYILRPWRSSSIEILLSIKKDFNCWVYLHVWKDIRSVIEQTRIGARVKLADPVNIHSFRVTHLQLDGDGKIGHFVSPRAQCHMPLLPPLALMSELTENYCTNGNPIGFFRKINETIGDALTCKYPEDKGEELKAIPRWHHIPRWLILVQQNMLAQKERQGPIQHLLGHAKCPGVPVSRQPDDTPSVPSTPVYIYSQGVLPGCASGFISWQKSDYRHCFYVISS